MRLRTFSSRLATLGLIAASSLALSLGCGSGGIGPGRLFNITCSVERMQVTAGSPDMILVTAVVTEGGSPADAVTVAFSTNLGEVTPDTVVTESAGRAIAFYQAPANETGTAVISARVVAGGPNQEVTTAPLQRFARRMALG